MKGTYCLEFDDGVYTVHTHLMPLFDDLCNSCLKLDNLVDPYAFI